MPRKRGKRKANEIPGGNNHHLWSPQKSYRGGIRKEFHDLKCQQVFIDYYAHQLWNTYIGHLPEPSLEDMKKAIYRHKVARICTCFIRR